MGSSLPAQPAHCAKQLNSPHAGSWASLGTPALITFSANQRQSLPACSPFPTDPGPSFPSRPQAEVAAVPFPLAAGQRGALSSTPSAGTQVHGPRGRAAVESSWLWAGSSVPCLASLTAFRAVLGAGAGTAFSRLHDWLLVFPGSHFCKGPWPSSFPLSLYACSTRRLDALLACPLWPGSHGAWPRFLGPVPSGRTGRGIAVRAEPLAAPGSGPGAQSPILCKVVQLFSVRGKLQIRICSCQSHVAISPSSMLAF